MPDSAGDDEALPGEQLHGVVVQVYEEATLDDIEELVLIGVCVPMVLALDDAQADHRVVHLTESLVVPPMGTGIDQRLDVYPLQGAILNVEPRFVGIGSCIGHGGLQRDVWRRHAIAAPRPTI
jgi:hypothetical protein